LAIGRADEPIHVAGFFHGYLRGAGTLHTIVGEPAKRRLLIGIGGDAAALEEDMLDISFDRWIEGEDLPVSHLEGQLGGMSKPVEWPRDVEGKRLAVRPLISSRTHKRYRHGRYRTQGGKHMLIASFSAFDPISEVGHVTAYIHSNRPRTPSKRRVEPATLRRSDPWGQA
jgi:hypothetical protein